MTVNDLELRVKEFLQSLVLDKKLQKIYSFEVEPPKEIDRRLLKTIISEPFLIDYDDSTGKLFFINSNNEKQFCPDIVNGITDARDWISECLPSVPFDIEQGGNVRRAAEAENIYKCTLVAGILKDVFLEGFNRILANYDFKNLKSSNTDGEDFSKLIKRWQNLQNLTVRIIVSGANYKISSEKKSDIGFVIGTLTKEETIGVVSIRIAVKNVIRKYMQNQLSQDNVKKLTKIERLTIIREKDLEERKTINDCPDYSELYKICDLNADYLSATTKLTLEEKAETFARQNVSSLFEDDYVGFNNFVSKCRRRAFKEAVISLKEEEVIKWRNEGNLNYRLISKR